jgi:hypothetical protein
VVPVDLSSFRAKLFHAHGHLKELDFSIHQFTDDPGSYSVLKECDSENGVYTFRLNLSRAMPMTHWGLIMGDCLHNLRSALDHLFYSLIVCRHGSVEPHGAKTADFPIFAKSERWFGVPGGKLSEIRKTKTVKWVGAEATAILERLQPFHTSRPNDHPLALLDKLDKTDKHRLLIPRFGVLESTDVSVIRGNRHLDRQEVRPFAYSRPSQGAILAKVTVEPPDAVMDVNLVSTKVQVLIEGDGGRRQPVMTAMKAIYDAVCGVAEAFGEDPLIRAILLPAHTGLRFSGG